MMTTFLAKKLLRKWWLNIPIEATIFDFYDWGKAGLFENVWWRFQQEWWTFNSSIPLPLTLVCFLQALLVLADSIQGLPYFIAIFNTRLPQNIPAIQIIWKITAFKHTVTVIIPDFYFNHESRQWENS